MNVFFAVSTTGVPPSFASSVTVNPSASGNVPKSIAELVFCRICVLAVVPAYVPPFGFTVSVYVCCSLATNASLGSTYSMFPSSSTILVHKYFVPSSVISSLCIVPSLSTSSQPVVGFISLLSLHTYCTFVFVFAGLSIILSEVSITSFPSFGITKMPPF